MKTIKLHFSFLALLSILLLTSCEATLAPAYDQAIVDKVTVSSDLAMRFFAEVDEGTDSISFPVREPVYNQLIGAFESLKLHAKARPVPSDGATKKINALLKSKGSNPIAGDYPSAFAFEQIAETFQRMKQTDREKGLNPIVIEAFKGQIEIYLDQAMTYESFLKR
ncbi:hypothetical protein K8089_09365 [Aequorivita sp. F47161]|uniref:DUF4142 domain-containing protein n=1 Tax=Aequorivita vitellina TaxID=2874475 RepID=A0A9X1QUY7_9FLAO|nr:hypothetical protein [Aequorivita vitellina]MCG2419230.1 hypothetical protein [Aequorivita vitellina]